MTQEITRSFDIDMGHRLMNHESKCRAAHGHRYTIEVSVRSATSLDENGRVIDFSVVKDSVGAWLNDIFDHAFCVQRGDSLEAWLEENGSKHVVLDVPPSIENLVAVWYQGAQEILSAMGLLVTRVRGYETAKCWADYTMHDAGFARAKANIASASALAPTEPAPATAPEEMSDE